ncbi:MAG: hypothetical protein QOK36_1493 [Gaiellales bacterium]|jgi:uncharacterized protein (DUF1800 family)|nr:hypothetical protein [Gaiellales bacterium]
MSLTKNKPHKAHKGQAQRVKTRHHRLHVPPASSTTFTPTAMSQSMVDRLFWRAGFGPSAADRAAWIGQPLEAAVDWLLNTPQGGLVGPEPAVDGKPLDPNGNDTDLVLSWVDRMVRTPNPFVERMTFFWHRHWANSRAAVSPTQLLENQNTLLRKYSDLAANPDVSFSDMALEVSKDPSMLRYLNGESNVKGGPNENYGRELMELFTLGVTHAITGARNYSENDVAQLAKALTGWYINDKDPDSVTAGFDSGRWFNGPKAIFGKLGNYNTDTAVDLVLAQDGHAPFIANKLWGEFMPTPPSTATLTQLALDYTASGRKIKPLVRSILTNPQLFESIDEPNMIKPPVVFVSGTLRALGLGIGSAGPVDYLDSMGQLPYFPPTVAGWEGGLSWLNTNTALARFGFVADAIANAPNGSQAKVLDIPSETPAAAFDRAYGAIGSPWMSAGTRAAIQDYAARASAKASKDRIARQVMLRTLMLAGPDAQVM